MGPRYPCKEYGDFRAAEDRRKHLNMLLMDYCAECERTYFPDGKPRPTEVKPETLPALGGTVELPPQPAKVVWAAVYKEGGPEAAQFCAMVRISESMHMR